MHVNRRCQVTTVEGVVVIFVDGAAWTSFDEDDVACRRLARVHLAERAVGTHAPIASAFGLEPLAVDRARQAYRQHGLPGLLPGKKGPKGPRVTGGRVDKVIRVQIPLCIGIVRKLDCVHCKRHPCSRTALPPGVKTPGSSYKVRRNGGLSRALHRANEAERQSPKGTSYVEPGVSEGGPRESGSPVGPRVENRHPVLEQLP